MADAGAQVVTLRADVSVRDDVARLLDEIADTMPPLRGVVHAAGVNDDALLAEQTWETFQHALAPKLAGGWHLFDLTRDLPLAMFVSFSSASSVVGGPAQANYAAANAFLDSLGALRRAETGVGLSIGWGPWDRVGMTARIAPADLERMARRGIRPLPAPRALDAFEDAVTASAAGGVAHLLALDLDRSALEDRSVLRDLRGTSPQRAPEELLRRWVETVPGRRRAAIAGFVTDQARKVLGLPADATISARQPFNELGLDSLMAVELRNALGAALGRQQPATLLFDHPTTDSLVDHLLEVVDAAAGGPDASTAAAHGDDGDDEIDRNGVDAVAALTEEEAEALLLAELDAETTP
jgi:acyl carrier protein